MKKLVFLLFLIGIVVTSGCIKQNENYIPPEGTTTTTASATPSFSDNDLEQGWYYGSFDQKKPGTPEHWLHKFEGSRSAMWFDPLIEDEDYCDAIRIESENIEETISKVCDYDDDCESRGYIESLTNAVKCFSKNDPTIADYDYAFDLYRELDCPLSMGGAPYSNVYCECTDGICSSVLET
jgi:hypothetical protein